MDSITFVVERDPDRGWFCASWDAPNGGGGIATQGKDLRVTVPNHRFIVPKTLQNILRQARLSLEEFLEAF